MYHKYRWWAVIALGLSLFIVTIDMTIVSLALPVIARGFHLSDSMASAVSLSYTVPMTLALLPVGLVLHRLRPLPTFLISVLGFGVGSLISGLSLALWMLLVGRIIQGIFGAVIFTQGIAVAAAIVKPSERGRAMGLLLTLGPLGDMIGPTLGGLLLSHWHWPVIFFVNLPICLLVSLLALFSLRHVTMTEDRPSEKQKANNGLGWMGTLFHNGTFLRALLALLCCTTIMSGVYYLVPFNMNSVQRFVPAIAGVILFSLPLGLAVMGPVGGYLADRYGVKLPMLSGLALMIIGLTTLTLIVGLPTAGVNMAWRLFLTGCGAGLFFGPNRTLLMSTGTRETMGAASALSNIGQNIGIVCGPLLVSITWSLLVNPSAKMVGGMLLLIVFCGIGLLLTWLATRDNHTPTLNLSTTNIDTANTADTAEALSK
jgi:MFS family permease